MILTPLKNPVTPVLAAPDCDDRSFQIHYWPNDIKGLIKSGRHLGVFEKKVANTSIPAGFVYRKGVAVETRLRIKADRRIGQIHLVA